MEEAIHIGIIKRTHGVKGEVQLSLRKGIELLVPKVKFLLLSEKNEQPVPWFPEKFTAAPGGYIVKFEGIQSEKEAKKLNGRQVFCSRQAIREENDSIEGFTVEDKRAGTLGTIAAVTEFPGQIIMTVISAEGKEILLPLNNEFVVNIDPAARKVLYDAPEGLIEIYLKAGIDTEERDDGDGDEVK